MYISIYEVIPLMFLAFLAGIALAHWEMSGR